MGVNGGSSSDRGHGGNANAPFWLTVLVAVVALLALFYGPALVHAAKDILTVKGVTTP